MRKPSIVTNLPLAMDGPEPESTPFDAISVQSNKFVRSYQNWLDKTTPYVPYRWCSTIVMFAAFIFRIIFVQGWYIVAYCLGIYLLNLFLAFLQPKYDPSLHADDGLEDGESSLPTKQDQEFRPFVRRLPEFKFWRAATRAIGIAFICSWFSVFDLPVFWPVLVMYWVILFCLTMRRQIQHMIKYRYIPFSVGKAKYGAK